MKILVTRPNPAANELVYCLRKLGKLAWAMPLIDFLPSNELQYLPNYLSYLQQGDLVFFMSQQVIKYTDQFLQKKNLIKWPNYLKYFAIGRCTAHYVYKFSNIKINYPFDIENSESLLKINCLQKIHGKKALILRGGPGGYELLSKTMIERGVEVKYCECYKRRIKHYNSKIEAIRWRTLGITTLVVTSSEMLQQIFMLFPPLDRYEWLLHCRLVVISERLAKQAIKLGWSNIDVAKGANNTTLIQKLVNTII